MTPQVPAMAGMTPLGIMPPAIKQRMAEAEQKVSERLAPLEDKIRLASRNSTSRYVLKLSNVGNPDFRQNAGRKLPFTKSGWCGADSLKECLDLCFAYIKLYDLGGGNWNGGQILERTGGKFVGRVAYNGRVFDSERWTPDSKEICVS